MFERPDTGENVVLVHIDFNDSDSQENLAEFQLLVKSSGATVVDTITGTRARPAAKYFVGKGKAEEIADVVRDLSAELVIFNHILSPAQERNLEHLFQCRVIDRVGLILDIFAQRARTFEGKLQVELAQLQHLSTRLVRGWTHLERQKGGIGLRGPGESQLETDRRLLRARITSIKKRLQRVRTRRQQSRAARQKAAVPIVSLVGYTNAGKSTVFNHLTGSNVLAVDKLFATLDPTLRRVELPGVGAAVLVDTVGFIRHLPHDLVESFRATLDETREADLLLHVIDTHHPARHENIDQVESVLQQIGADKVPRLEVYNKIDLEGDITPRIERNQTGESERVWISALRGDGIEFLKKAIAERLQTEIIQQQLRLPPSQGKLRAALYAQNAVVAEHMEDDGDILLTIRLARAEFERLCREAKVDISKKTT